MFREFVGGSSLRELAHALNADRIASPRVRGWSVSALQVLLANPIHRGERIFNCSERVKDHETRRRRRYERPESEWVRREEPALAIVEPATWWAARCEAERRRKTAKRDDAGKFTGGTEGAKSSHARQLLAGLCACGLHGRLLRRPR
jgi:site-specific DNA recombinase